MHPETTAANARWFAQRAEKRSRQLVERTHRTSSSITNPTPEAVKANLAKMRADVLKHRKPATTKKAKVEAKIAVRAAAKNAPKAKLTTASAPPSPQPVTSIQATTASTSAAPQDGKMTLAQVKAALKQIFPGIKRMADAKRSELERLLQAHQGDSLLAELQEVWKGRWEQRVGKWKAGTSPSAQKLRATVA